MSKKTKQAGRPQDKPAQKTNGLKRVLLVTARGKKVLRWMNAAGELVG